MSKTTRKMIFCDPILKKGHYHASKLKEPNVDEELDLYFKGLDDEEEELMRQQQEQLAWEEEFCDE